jgi:HEAT repeat protein
VDGFISGEGEDADLSQRIRDEAASLYEAGALDPVLDAMERLALAAPLEDPNHVACELARSLATPAVSAGLAMRLAGAREGARREELTQACRCLGEEGPVALATALAEADDRSARRNLVEGLVSMGDEGLKQAELMVQEGSAWGVVRNGVTILGELGGERAVEHLMETVRHHHPRVRRETLTALARVGGVGATLLVMGMLDDQDEEVRATAVRASAVVGSERTVKVLLARLDEEESQDVQEEILRALGQFGDPVVVPAIEKRAVGSFFSRPPASTRIAAYRALAAIGTPRARSLVEAAAEDKDAEVKSVARSLVAADREARSGSGASVTPSEADAQEP